MKKYVVLKGCAGLGNRLTTLLKAIKYANASGRVLFVDWDDGMFAAEGDNAFFKYFELKNVDFTDDKDYILNLFKSGRTCYPHDLEYEDINQTVYNRFHMVSPLASKFVPYKYLATSLFKDKLTYVAGLQSIQKNSNGVNNYFSALANIRKEDNVPLGGSISLRHDEDLLLFYDARPIVDMKELTKYVAPNKEIRCLIDENVRKYGIDSAIGVHVRYTDKKPLFFLSRLYKMLSKELCKDPNQRIFLCTDNNDIIDIFKSKYGDNVFMLDKYIPKVPEGYGIHNWSRKNSTGDVKEKMAIDSILDMWLLSRTRKLYWQGNSSFSYISKYLKNDPSSTINWMKIF